MRGISITTSLYSILFITLLISFSTTSFAESKKEKPAPDQMYTTAPDPIEIEKFTVTFAQIKALYVEPVTDKEIFENALRGMLSGLDPHSSYLDLDEYKNLRADTEGEFGGLGIEITMDGKYIKVISPIDDTPAFKAGIKPGDIIFRIDGAPVNEMTLFEAVKQLRGKPDTDVELSILREGADKPITVAVTRKVIEVKSVKSEMLEPHYGYVKISQFQNQTAQELKKHIDDLQAQSPQALKGLVLDLRNNPGGLLSSAVEVSDYFLNEGLIVYTQGRTKNSRYDLSAQDGELLPNTPIVVLVNEGSASGSEIVAGALQDHNRALVAGKKTFGKGSVQTVLPLNSSSAIKLTTARYYTPNGRSIQAEGIKPDIVIEDLTIPVNEDDKNKYRLTEAQLSKHLESESKTQDKANSDNQTQDDKDDTPLVNSDYQLYEATNLLKAQVIMTRNTQPKVDEG